LKHRKRLLFGVVWESFLRKRNTLTASKIGPCLLDALERWRGTAFRSSANFVLVAELRGGGDS